MRKVVAGSLLGLLLFSGDGFGIEVFSTNSVWRFRRGASEASAPTMAWRTNGFNDVAAGFTNAPGPFWYGDLRTGGTVLNDMSNSYRGIFLRQSFVVTNAAQAANARLGAFVDDGFVAWINGTEVKRVNLPAGEPTYLTLATNATEPVPLVIYELPAPAGYLVSGTNVLAVQVFNASLTSSDLGFDASLTVVFNETNAPTITRIVPPPGTVSYLTNIAVTFSEPVVGVQAEDLLLNGIPATSLSASNTTYTFSFAQPIYGTTFITWATGHGIADEAFVPNAFNATAPGATWQYNLVDQIPPTVANLFPASGQAMRSLSQIEVTFNETVAGVNASDLLINGQPATNVTQQVGGPFIFRFPQPQTTGTVSVTWATGHGITDTATSPNPFAGGAWTYTLDTNLPLADLVISEILAANLSTNGLTDEDGELQEWIEIHNRGTLPVNLANWSLSDDPTLPGLWTFPSRTLAPNQYLVVFASGKDRSSTNSATPLHTNFKLSSAGESLGLYSPDAPRLLVSGFNPFPEQRNDISYGRDATNALRYFATPTPGAANGFSTITGVCASVHVNVQRGHFVTPFDLAASSETAGAECRYTTDGSEPTASSPLFPALLRISTTTLFRVAAFKTNTLPSRTTTHSYFFNLPASLRSLPVISIVTASNNLYGPSGILGISGGNYNNGAWQANTAADYHNPSKHGLTWEKPTSIEWIAPADHSGFQTDCGIRVQGSDWQRPRLTTTSKFSFRLYFRSDYGPGRLDYPLFPLTAVQRFDQIVLRAGFNEQYNPFIRDEIHRRLSSDMGQIASHGTLAVVFVDGVYYAGAPWYNPCERVHEEFFQQHLGGDEDWDVVGPSFASSSGAPGVVDGDRVDFESLVSYVNSQSVTTPAIYSNIARRLDLTNFVDYCLLNAYAATGDWPGNNWRAGCDRTNGIWRFAIWDAEWGMGIYGRSVTINSFTQTGPGPNDSGLGSVSSSEIAQLYDRLRASAEFRLLWADRVQKHFFNGGVLMGSNITNRFMELRNQLYPLMGEMDATILNWARDRQAIFFPHMDAYGLIASTNAPGFNVFGGRVPVGFSLVITNTGGTIYYTTNGSDPRTAFSGTVAASALSYSGPVALGSSVTIRARALTNGKWSALTEATFTVGALGIPLRLTEVMYNPIGGSIYEFLELSNPSGAAVDLGGMYFDGINYQFNEGAILPAGARLVLGSNTDTNEWKLRYPGVTAAGWFSGNLNNGGERIALYDRFGNPIFTVDYSDGGGWPTAADGGGRSLELVNLNGNPDDPANWQASAATNGSPGSANSVAAAPVVFINEIIADNPSAVNHGGTFPDWVELYNSSASPVNLAGWSLSDDGNARKFVFPSTTIPAFGYLTVWCDATTNITPGLHTGFSLDREGDSVFLYDAATNRVDALSFGLQAPNYSIGRVSGNWTLTSPTTNAANVAVTPASAPNLVINEWMANPLPGQPDWIELFNLSASAPVALQGVYLSTSNQIHRLPALAFLAPRSHLLLLADEGVGPNHLDFKLPATGDSITLSDASGAPIQKVVYPAQAEGVSRGRLPDGAVLIYNFPGSASPGTTNYQANYAGPVLNEVLARNRTVSVGGAIVDFIELFNGTGASYNLGGMSLSVNAPDSARWTFPANTTLAADAYLVIRCDGASPAATNAGAFNLGTSLEGESGGVYLFNATGQLMQSVEYGPQVDDLPIGLSSGAWKLLSAVTPGAANAAELTLGSAAALRVNEWMAAPTSGADWFEIYNLTNRPVDLSTIALSDDPSLVGTAMFRPAPLSFIGPNGFVKWVADADAGQGRNHVNFGLDAQGDSALIYSVAGTSYTLVDAVGFGAQTSGISQGNLPDGADATVPFPGSPTPGESNYRLIGNLVINEALTHTDPPLEDAIELRNTIASPVNIGGWFLSNSKTERRKFQLPAGTTVPANGYLVIYENQFNNGTSNAFTLNSAQGDQIWISAAAAGVETGYRLGTEFGAAFNGVSFGRVVTSSGVDFVPLTARTFGVDNPATLAQFRTGTGLSNAAPIIGPVIISEVLYHPPGGTAGDNEFIELQNNSASAVPLYNPAYPTNQWKLGGGVDFTFPANTTLAASSYLLVVDFDPANPAQLAAFRTRYGISGSVPVFGPFSGALDNASDSVELYRPDTPQQAPSPDAGFVPYVMIDRVKYTDTAPWPQGDGVDGGGLSLQRAAPTLYGNEATNWFAAAPTPGSVNVNSTDSDGDGIPDWAEDQMGLDRNNPADAALDPDHDGMTNLQEYLAGTDHLNASSNLHFDLIHVGANVSLTFQTVANKTYSVLYKNALTDPTWTKLADVAASTTTQTQVVNDSLGNRVARFYRLVTPAQTP